LTHNFYGGLPAHPQRTVYDPKQPFRRNARLDDSAVSEHDKIRSRLSSAIEKIKKLSEERGDLDLDQARIAIHLAQDELEIAQSLIRREIIAERDGH
jgi:hypothetical protein